MNKIQTTDNNYGQHAIVINGVDAQNVASEVRECVQRILMPYAGVDIARLAEENPGLLVFPSVLGKNDDCIGEKCIYSLPAGNLTTHNIAGIVGIGKGEARVELSIHSRFDMHGEKQYFLNTMLTHVLGINLLNLDVFSGEERIWDLLPYLFPYFLNEAASQGLFRAYQNFRFNDTDVRGTINIARHIDENIPFKGTVAYETREYSDNNMVMQLVRHVIEYISSRSDLRGILQANERIRRNITLVRMATPDYNRLMRQRVLQKNSRIVRHPYYTKWTDLQRLCRAILNHDKLSFDGECDGIHGVVFDVAWLWEEYLAITLKKFGYTHAEINTGINGLWIFENRRNESIYPDFYSLNKKIVLDAKYKHLDYSHKIDRDDLYQMISYIHILNGYKAILLYPRTGDTHYEVVGTLRGCGGEIGKLGFKVPSSNECKNYSEYEVQINNSMESFLLKLKSCEGERRVSDTLGGARVME